MPTTNPTPNAFGSLQYFPGNASLVLVDTGNYTAFPQPSLQTWQWQSGNWSLINATAASNPPPRTGMGMAYDGSKMILFGGRGVEGTGFMNDLWGYNSSSVWSQLEPNHNTIGLAPTTITTSIGGTAAFPIVVQSGTNGPLGLTIRTKPYMFTLSSGVMLWGGQNMQYMLQDSYLWNGSAWSTLSPASTPSIRTGAAFSSNGTTAAVIVGGANSSSTLNDSWVYTTGSSTWTQLTTNTPPSVRRDAIMEWYPTGSYYLLFGGQDTAGNCLNDTWTLSISGTTGTWTQLSPASSPSRRVGAMMAYDTSSSQMILFGGKNNSNLLNDTWNWTGTNWAQL